MLCPPVRMPTSLKQLVVPSLLAALSASPFACTQPPAQVQMDRPATAAEISQWRKESGFSVADETEVREAARLQRGFVRNRAVSPDQSLSVRFRMGEMIGDPLQGASTTSTYQLSDASGRVLITAPSRMARSESAGSGGNSQLAWFSPDGSTVLVYEFISECNGPPPLSILFFKDPGKNHAWSVRFPDLGDTLNRPFDEGDHPECRGLLGREILIRNTHDGISKIRIDRLKERHPFPFTVG